MTDQPPPYQPYVAYPPPYVAFQPPPSKAMAIWALVLSLLGLCGITALVGLGLGIVALVRVKSGRAAGRGMAVAAVVISLLWILAYAGLVGVGAWFSSTLVGRDAYGHITRPGQVFLTDLRVGDCVKDVESHGLLNTVTGVPCSEQHKDEAFMTFDLPGGLFPGQDVVDLQSEQRCFQELRAAAGAEASTLAVVYVRPSRVTWRHDRSVMCIAHRGVPSTGSIRDSTVS
jgi:hypothetical protein